MVNNPTITEHTDNDDFLHGGAAIGAYLRHHGLNVTDTDVYYLVRTKKIAVGRWGKHLIASKRRLDRDLKRAAQALTA